MDHSMSDSDQSRRSLHSHHSGDSTSGATESQLKSVSGHKEAAYWRLKEETTLLQYLYDNRSGTDGTTFPKRIYSDVSAHLAEHFKNQKGGAKTNSACNTKFSSLKKAYHATQALKKWGGNHRSAHQAEYVKSNPNAKQFKNKGFEHFEIFDLLMAGMNATGIYVRQRQRKNHTSSAASATSMPPPLMIPSTSTRPPAELHFHELSIATKEISVDMGHLPASSTSTDPLATTSHVPSTSPPSALTSTSQGKCKASALDSDVDALSGKRSHPPSATARAQLEGSAVITSLVTAMETMSKHLSVPPVLAAPISPTSDFACTIEIISDATYISDDDKLDMTQLFVRDKDQATAFLYLKGDNLRANWVKRRLGETRAMHIDTID
ncbi:hypothetical protein DFJ58DRAFT_733421 [Suillus subalutaceus]|uniref:uncharacterized protein n=1 Tax=Suillus subalutaceus TaxID=48586 RepID=UPI001B865F99|nr:uncharacterized protein DFJ58DRAFT_733421 [Suillus subalutaceus]KAG1839200.1 hypothetical protein DFJ58DRAFT_733421 [Suillus subalutaceus]